MIVSINRTLFLELVVDKNSGSRCSDRITRESYNLFLEWGNIAGANTGGNIPAFHSLEKFALRGRAEENHIPAPDCLVVVHFVNPDWVACRCIEPIPDIIEIGGRCRDRQSRRRKSNQDFFIRPGDHKSFPINTPINTEAIDPPAINQ